MVLLGPTTRLARAMALSVLSVLHVAVGVQSSSALSSRGSGSGGTVTVPPTCNFVLNGLAGQPPQTRYYDFVVTETPGAPDGFNRPMLIVNGERVFGGIPAVTND